jgi:hypothetical protein
MPTKFGELGRTIEQVGFAKIWHQGSAIAVTSPENTAFTRISGNYIENAAQGIDIHSDNFICTENTVNHGMMGMKAMHGSRNGIIAHNVFSHVDNWGIALGPGASSHSAETSNGGQPARESNSDGNVVISGNVISDFGRGHEFWNWGGTGPDAASKAVIRINKGQIPSNPSLTNVLIEGNMITNADEELGPRGELIHPKSRYRYAVLIDSPSGDSDDYHYPQNIRMSNNLFAAGQDGISNILPVAKK